jgi:hypothetical protein
MAAPPPHDGPCKRCGGDEDVTALGRYRGLCATCRPIVAEEQKAARARREPEQPPRLDDDSDDGIEGELRARASQRGKLRIVCQELVGKADALEEAIEERAAARIHAQSALHEFKEALQLVGRVAQSLVNARAETSE